MCEIDHKKHTVDQGIPDRYQGVHAPLSDTKNDKVYPLTRRIRIIDDGRNGTPDNQDNNCRSKYP